MRIAKAFAAQPFGGVSLEVFVRALVREHTCQMPAVVFYHEPQISCYNSIELFKAITHVLIQIFVAQVHDLDGKLAAELPQTRDNSQKLSCLAVACSEYDSATAVVEAGVQ
jgi:hypothetical protein